MFREPGATCGILKVRGMKGPPGRRVHRRVEKNGPNSAMYTQLFHVVQIALMAPKSLLAT